MSTLVRFLLIFLLAGIEPLLARNGGGTDSSRAASTIDNTPPGTLNPEPLPPLANPRYENQGFDSGRELKERVNPPTFFRSRKLGLQWASGIGSSLGDSLI
jgi:hypothetical protein